MKIHNFLKIEVTVSPRNSHLWHLLVTNTFDALQGLAGFCLFCFVSKPKLQMTKCKGKRCGFLCRETTRGSALPLGPRSALVDVGEDAVGDALAIPLPGQAVLLLTVVLVTSLPVNQQADEIDHVEIG